MTPSATAVVLTWLIIAAGEVLAPVRAHWVVVKAERSRPRSTKIQVDTITEGLRQTLAQEPTDFSDESQQFRNQVRADLERSDRLLQEALDARQRHLSFPGYLANRIPEKWGAWNDPWPAVFWGAEIMLGSTLGAWQFLRMLKKSRDSKSFS